MHARPVSLLAGIIFMGATAGCLVADNGGRPGSDFRTGTGGNNGYGGSGGAGGYAGYGGSGSGSGGAGGDTATNACVGGSTSNFRVAWTIEDENGAPSTCDGVAAVEMDLDMLNLDTNVDYHGVFACSEMGGTSCELPAGAYSLAMRLRDGQGNVLSLLTAPEIVYIAANSTNDLGSLPFSAIMGMSGPGQGVGLSWQIERRGATVTCQQASAATVELTIGAQKFPFACSAGMGISPPVGPGTFPVSVSLQDAQGVVLSVTQTMPVAIPAGKLVDLGSVPFEVN